MPIIDLKTINFPLAAAIPNGTQRWDLPWPELVWAAVSVGKGSLAHMLQYGQYSMFEIIYRSAIIYANLLEKPDTRFARSDAYDGLDPSEKGAISYFLGLALTKAFVAQKLDVPWLMHLDLYRNRFGVNLAPGERPDLFGHDSLGRWVIAESKGRTHAHDQKALAKAKAQASQVIDVGGSAPHLSIGLVASFQKGRLALVVDDPPVDESGERISLQVSEEEFRRTYYRPFEELLAAFPAQEERIGNHNVRVIRSESADLFVGIANEYVQAVKAPLAGEVPRRPTPEVRDLDRKAYLGSDGIYVRLGESWNEELMQLQPQERRV